MATKKTALKKPKPAKVAADVKAGVLSVAGMPPRVWVSCGLTINRGNYESARVDAGMAMDVPPDSNEATTFDTCWENAEREVKRQFNAIRSEFPAKG